MRDKIVVVGGGFAGLKFARKLNGKKGQKVMHFSHISISYMTNKSSTQKCSQKN